MSSRKDPSHNNVIPSIPFWTSPDIRNIIMRNYMQEDGKKEKIRPA